MLVNLFTSVFTNSLHNIWIKKFIICRFKSLKSSLYTFLMKNYLFKVFAVFFCLINSLNAVDFIEEDEEDSKGDPNGYIMFCPCMGR